MLLSRDRVSALFGGLRRCLDAPELKRTAEARYYDTMTAACRRESIFPTISAAEGHSRPSSSSPHRTPKRCIGGPAYLQPGPPVPVELAQPFAAGSGFRGN